MTGFLVLAPVACFAQEPAMIAPVVSTSSAAPASVRPFAPALSEPPSATPESMPATALSPVVAEQAAAAPMVGESATDEGFSRLDLPHNLSPLGMFMAADWVVKAVMVSLAFASLVTWTVWLAKTLQLAGARVRTTRGLNVVLKAHTLERALADMAGRGGVVVSMLSSAGEEIRLSDAAIDQAGGEGVKERVASALARIEVRAGRHIAKGTGVLATIGSTAPFVGLFGTVWGIMNSFIGISESQTTNLAIVAPGIAEALLATAIGLVAAIPAVIIYNVLARSVTAYRQLLGDAAAGIERLISRDLDYRTVRHGAKAAALAFAAE
ncbi:tonB-system energizer ExbB [Ciceribacter naphthalenivorans]|uniref:tonB-system energizer ExbB n=1 Tax=Ciceribacter naphthalenivorans TaxID=1118451 RepID=UPI00353102BA